MELTSFQLFIVFLLATTGLVFITNKSKLFQPVRSVITNKYVNIENRRLMNNSKMSFKVLFWWWLSEIFSCYMCMSFYMGSIVSVLCYFSIYIPWIIYIILPFASTPVVCIVVQHWTKAEKK